MDSTQTQPVPDAALGNSIKIQPAPVLKPFEDVEFGADEVLDTYGIPSAEPVEGESIIIQQCTFDQPVFYNEKAKGEPLQGPVALSSHSVGDEPTEKVVVDFCRSYFGDDAEVYFVVPQRFSKGLLGNDYIWAEAVASDTIQHYRLLSRRSTKANIASREFNIKNVQMIYSFAKQSPEMFELARQKVRQKTTNGSPDQLLKGIDTFENICHILKDTMVYNQKIGKFEHRPVNLVEPALVTALADVDFNFFLLRLLIAWRIILM